jgi:hypothetical protein
VSIVEVPEKRKGPLGTMVAPRSSNMIANRYRYFLVTLVACIDIFFALFSYANNNKCATEVAVAN